MADNTSTLMRLSIILFLVNGWLLSQGQVMPEGTEGSYRVESISMPKGLTAVTGAIGFLPGGRLIACFLRGEVMTYNPQTKEWALFANGLQEPLGMHVISDSEIIVMQRPELTRIKDTDGDGHADLFETVTDAFGISGNYHEFNYGPLKDKQGNLFIGLNTSSTNGNIRKEVRGRLDTFTMKQKGQMFSPVPFRGWVMKLTPQGNLIPFASGLRSPNGLAFDIAGNLFATENQGDWVGTSALYHLVEGGFYGHPASLVWRANWNRGIPYELPVAELDKMRTKASVLFPHGIMANSPTQPLCDATRGKFGPFAGQFFVGEMNQARIIRVMLEEIDGALQGACIPFITGHGLRKGNNRLVFAPDGSLWVGQAQAQGWTGDEGIQRIVFTGKPPVDIQNMHLTATGFELSFTEPVNEGALADKNNYSFRRYFYEYHKKYGSDQFGVQAVPVTHIKVYPGGRKVSVTLESMKPGYVYELTLANIKTRTGRPLENNLICYTLNRLKGK
jgi:glucose/arabinose dehydrogenase